MNLLSDLQFGFRAGRLTADAVSAITRNVREAFEEGDTLSLTLYDLSRAFDCVAHPNLLKKLEFYKLRGAALSIFASYLSGRSQLVSIGAVSQRLLISAGVCT